MATDETAHILNYMRGIEANAAEFYTSLHNHDCLPCRQNESRFLGAINDNLIVIDGLLKSAPGRAIISWQLPDSEITQAGPTPETYAHLLRNRPPNIGFVVLSQSGLLPKLIPIELVQSLTYR